MRVVFIIKGMESAAYENSSWICGVFDTEEKAKNFLSKQSRRTTGVHEVDTRWEIGYTIVGDLAAQCVKESGEYYKLRIDLDSSYALGKSWRDTH